VIDLSARTGTRRGLLVPLAGRAVAIGVALAACGGGSHSAKPAKPSGPTHVTRTIPVADTEPEDGVEIVSTHGHMDPAVVDAGLTPHKESLSDCYTTRVGKRRWLGGHVALHWDINKAGEVTAVKLAESDLGAWPVEKCLLEVARMATFGKPIGGDADFMVPLDFTAKGKPAFWDEDQGIRAVGGQLAKLDTCAKAKGVKGGHPSDVTITVYIGPQGKAQSVGFSSAKTVLDDAWADCAEKAALAWRLPVPKGQIAKLAVRYRP
jgi:hypothetical protein